MKTRFSKGNQSAFFTLRLLLGLLNVLTGISLTLVGSSASSSLASRFAKAQQKYHPAINSISLRVLPPGFDCSKIHELGIDRQENLRAGMIMIACGQAEGGSASPSSRLSRLIQSLLPAPLVYGTADVDIITGPQTYPNITQSETFIATNPDNPNQIVVAYNDTRGADANLINAAGASVSTDGGNTFSRLTSANGQSPFNGDGSNYGDPVVVYNRSTATWHTIWLDGGCGSGSAGIGGYKSNTPWDPNSWSHYCIHNNTNDDRESGWADNNPSSPFYGRMYVSWNDFNVNGGALFVRYSTDNGGTWSNPQQLSSIYYINAQITGDLVTGDVYVAAMDPIGGGLDNRANLFYRSTDGGNTWTNTYAGAAFPGPGRGAVGFYATMLTTHLTGDTLGSASLPLSTEWSTMFMLPATLATATLVTSFTSVPPTRDRPSVLLFNSTPTPTIRRRSGRPAFRSPRVAASWLCGTTSERGQPIASPPAIPVTGCGRAGPPTTA